MVYQLNSHGLNFMTNSNRSLHGEKITNIIRFFMPLFLSMFFLLFFSLYGLCDEGISSKAKSSLKSENKYPSDSDNLSPLLDELINDIDQESYKLEPQVSSSSIRGSTAKAGEEPVTKELSKSTNINEQQVFQGSESLKLLKEIRAVGDIIHLSALAIHVHFLENISKTVDPDFNSKQLLAEAIQKLQKKAPNLRSKNEVKSVLLAYMEIMGTSDPVLSEEKDKLSRDDEKFQKLKKDITLEFEKFKEE